MSNPAWSLDNITWNYFLGSYRYGGHPQSLEENNIFHETDSGKGFSYSLYTKKTFELVFTVGLSQWQSFVAFHTAVNGQGTPFYFSLTGSTSDAVFVRKEAGLDPEEDRSPGNREPLFHYTMRLREEIP